METAYASEQRVYAVSILMMCEQRSGALKPLLRRIQCSKHKPSSSMLIKLSA